MNYFSLGILARELASWQAVVHALLTGRPPRGTMQAEQMRFLTHVLDNPPDEITFIPEGWGVKEADMDEYRDRGYRERVDEGLFEQSLDDIAQNERDELIRRQLPPDYGAPRDDIGGLADALDFNSTDDLRIQPGDLNHLDHPSDVVAWNLREIFGR